MLNIALAVQLFLLQDDQIQYYKPDNPVEGMIVFIAIGVVILFAVVYHLIRNGIGSSGGGTRSGAIGGGGAPRKFNAFTLYRISSEYGLDKDQSKLLENIFKNNAVTDPERVIKNSSLLDRQFKRTYKSIEKNSETEEDAQQHLVKLFSLRNVIEAGSDSNNPASTQLAENTPAILVSGNDNYPVRLYSSRGLNIVTEIPRNAVGTPVRMSKGANVTLSFFTKSSKGFALEGQVTGVVETSHGQGLQITHNGKMKPLVKRMYRRRQITIRCSFYHVFLEDSGMGRKKSQKLVVDNKRLTGHVLDVSIGGCSIKTTAPIQVGSRLKIAIDYDENYVINVLGQVIRTNRSGPAGAIIHIKFLKVPRRAFNSISALVFGYDED